MRPEYREEPCKTALNPVKGMPFRWSLNPYMGCVHRCTFCYVRAFEKRSERSWDSGYGASIRVKTNIADVLAMELRRRRNRGDEVAVGTATDPYQPAEGSYRLTRRCLEALAAVRNPFGIITRGPMVVRDIDLLQSAAGSAKATVSVSIPTLDRDVWRTTEPGTAPPQQRLRAVRKLADAGVDVHVALAPLLPGLSDTPNSLAAVVREAKDAGASAVWCRVLELRPGTREHFMENLQRDWPALVPRYERMYQRAYVSRSDAEPVEQLAQRLAGDAGFAPRERWRPEPVVNEPGAQLALFA